MFKIGFFRTMISGRAKEIGRRQAYLRTPGYLASAESGDMLGVFHLLPVPEIIVPKKSAMSQLLTERARRPSRPRLRLPSACELRC